MFDRAGLIEGQVNLCLDRIKPVTTTKRSNGWPVSPTNAPTNLEDGTMQDDRAMSITGGRSGEGREAATEWKLTRRQNLKETMAGGHPERFVNQYEFMTQVFDPIFIGTGGPMRGQMEVANAWGVVASWKEEWIGQMPVHTPDKIVIKDIDDWKEYVHHPNLDYPEAAWEPAIAAAEAVDRNDKYVAAVQIPGIFEQAHHLGEIKNILMAFYESPDELKDLFKYITDYELQKAERVIAHIHPDALFHHDDWGSQTSTFISPEMFDEFLTPLYKEVYKYWHDNGVELIVHHSDSYAATLVPSMIEMGIDIWQGVMNTNDIPGMIEKYGKDITFMGGIDSATIDYPEWKREDVAREVARACEECGPYYFIPSASQGGDYSSFDGVYDATTEEIDKYSKVYWAEHHVGEPDEDVRGVVS